MEIVELETEEHYREAFPVMKELRTHLEEEQFLSLTADMVWDGYRLFAARDDHGAIVGLCGTAVCLNLYDGRHLWVYDLVTSENHRSRGVGAALLQRMEELAREEGCGCIALSSGVQRADAHRFYEERAGYERKSYVYIKDVPGVASRARAAHNPSSSPFPHVPLATPTI